MKFNWGTGIFLFYCFFATSLFIQVYQSTQYDHSLVADDYYAKDIAYQSMYDKKQNSLSLSEVVDFDFRKEEHQLHIGFPKSAGKASGKVTFYRPQRGKDDLHLNLETNQEGMMVIPLDQIANGRWRVQVDWKANGKAYFDESYLFIPERL